MNSLAQPLQLHEAEAIQKTQTTRTRVLKSYKMMLGFYGMKLVDEERGTIQRAGNYRERFENLTW
ncbi:dentin sialophosphoprotein-like isoform X2 [Biomphalaria pfeifferi]|uniref:Dentin sialophosphoprotein-like isoform X2 n=1 Tax=Biomphalaria pfeifferi TaxID=112525 RepID=A0AAD8BID9_BIOPF|nr:dentin sialophosphoprotein-like isoform X2 [Biomphalaria pfeifferi]